MEAFNRVLGHRRSNENCWQKKWFFGFVRSFLVASSLLLFVWNSYKLYYSWKIPVDLHQRMLLEILLFIVLLFYLAVVWTWVESKLEEKRKPEPWLKSVWNRGRRLNWLKIIPDCGISSKLLNSSSPQESRRPIVEERQLIN